jgi:hypothetical protein
MVSGSIADGEVGLGFSAATDALVSVSPLAATDWVVAARFPHATADPPGWLSCDGITGQFDDVGIGKCAIPLDGAENTGETVVHIEMAYNNGRVDSTRDIFTREIPERHRDALLEPARAGFIGVGRCCPHTIRQLADGRV